MEIYYIPSFGMRNKQAKSIISEQLIEETIIIQDSAGVVINIIIINKMWFNNQFKLNDLQVTSN